MRNLRMTGILATAALASIVSLAQSSPKGGTTSGATTGSTTSTGITGTSTTGSLPGSLNSTTNNNTNSSASAASRGEFYFGKVVMQDGTAPPNGVVIERVCNGTARPQAYVDSRGDFSFQVGHTQDMLPDATVDTPQRGSAGGSLNQTSSSAQQTMSNQASNFNCDLRANLAGYRSDTISLAGRRSLDDPNVGTITLHSLGHYEGLTTSATSALAPKDARRAYEKGLEAMRKSKTDEAQADFLKATGLYPRYAAAWFELGLTYEQRAKIPEARDAYAKSIAADSKFVNPYAQLYLLSFAEKNWVETARISNQVMHLNPYDFPESLYYNAVANSQLLKLDVAEKSAREALQLSGNKNPKIYYILGVILAKKQDFKAATEYLRTYLKSDAVTDRDQVTRLLADCEKQVQARAEAKSQ